MEDSDMNLRTSRGVVWLTLAAASWAILVGVIAIARWALIWWEMRFG